MRACVRACVSVCTFMSMCMCACVRACVCACMRACVHACVRACVRVRACVHECVRACMRAFKYACDQPHSPIAVLINMRLQNVHKRNTQRTVPQTVPVSGHRASGYNLLRGEQQVIQEAAADTQ